MRFYIVLLFVTITIYGITVVNGQIETACIGVNNDQFVNNPMSCAHYYFCRDQQAFPAACGEVSVFNTVTQHCDFPGNVDCDNRPCSSRGIQTLPIAGSCATYTQCTHGMATVETCATGLHFDPTNGKCSQPTTCVSTEVPSVTEPPTPPPTDPPTDPITGPPTAPPPPVTPPPTPTEFRPDCSGAQIFHAHPIDCSRFVICFEGIALQGQCENGELWNQFVNRCDAPANVKCVQNTDYIMIDDFQI